MNAILAGYVGELDRKDGRGYYECPVCGEITFQSDIERYEGADKVIECCTTCREEFELDAEVELDSDMPDAETIERMWQWAHESVCATDRSH